MAEPKPRDDRVLVKVLDDREQPSGLIIPGGVSTVPSRGTVMYVGPGYRRPDGDYVPLDLKPGDEVVFFKGRGTEIRINDEDMLLLRDQDVLVITDPASVMQEQAHSD